MDIMGRKKKTQADYSVARHISAVLLVLFGALMLLASFHKGGFVSEGIFVGLYAFFGYATFALPLIIIILGASLFINRFLFSARSAIGASIIGFALLSLSGFVNADVGGIIGSFFAQFVSDLFGSAGAVLFLVALVGIGVIVLTDITKFISALTGALDKTKDSLSDIEMPSIKLPVRQQKEDSDASDEQEESTGKQSEETMSEREPVVRMFNDSPSASTNAPAIRNIDEEYTPPPTSLLSDDKGKPGVGDIKANANIIRRTFANFGISVEMDEVSVGPTVTRYALKPAEGVRLQKIISLQTNLELALAAHPVRIEAPIPGKSLVGIEVPNAQKATVGLGGVLSDGAWKKSDKPLLTAIGRDITGTPHYINVAKMPHGLVAGTTGSGKSVAIHALITSLLYRNGPNALRFIMVDPKRVELTQYNGIPHLLTPVITDAKKCILSLKWAAKEMDRRYNVLEEKSCRDIDSYHTNIFEPAKKAGGENIPEAMPYIVIIIDELADIMQSYPRELEASIVRLAQMSRAVGIHLILSTQRPSVNVITGLIKANVPSRLALKVGSQIDSRTILDAGGAEMLLGAGDMLYQGSDMQKPVRLQSAFISEAEVKKVVSFIKQHNAGSLGTLDLQNGNGEGSNEPNDAIDFSAGDDDVDDDMYAEAKAAVEQAGKASTSYLQRKLRVGYSRAARLMDILEAKGVIGPQDGAKPRDVLSQGASSHEGDDAEQEV
jgi:S-DNA-T family DNA segregation ATPase FtsK/SpoIIIE